MPRITALLSTTCASAIAAIVATFSTPAEAQSAPQCGESYTVQPGDSLSQIAAAVYDDASAFQIIYSANSEAIGGNPGIISVGLQLDIPCLNDTVASTAAAFRPEPTTERLPFPNTRQIRVAQGTNWAPFANEDQEQGGMITEIANVALANSANGTPYKIDFINDWGAHLTPLVTDIAYDFSLSWFKPNCDQIDRLGEDSQFRCNNFDWSEPMFEQVFGYYTRAAEPALSSYSDLFGKTICRPAGYATFQLEENDLKEPNITMVRPSDPAECFTRLINGSVDAVTLAVDTADLKMLETGTTDQVRYNEPLSQVLTIHAVISKNHPQGAEMLGEFNSGLNAIKETGEWFQIIRRHLTEHRARTQG
ncbi:MAG: transporter substrate-binding domain-containing protein [Pseudomonadota bacterium]